MSLPSTLTSGGTLRLLSLIRRATRYLKHTRTFATLGALLLLACLCAGPRLHVAAQSATEATEHTAPLAVSDDAACLPCHKEQSASYFQTTHHLTSRSAAADTIFGSFAEGSNTLVISADPHLSFKMEATPSGFFQTAIAEDGPRKLIRKERIDLVIGSGTRGQTFLYWHGDQLFELPVSYWTEGNQWINSPGYIDGTANFARHVDPRCLECHVTLIRPLSPDPQTNLYDKTSLVPGISCQSCHGPSANHIAQQRNPATAGPAANILNPDRFSRDRQIDACALCHNGTARQQLAPAFTYIPGQSLDRYLAPTISETTDRPDVHGNQVGLLERSRCFLSSPAMSCSTCHNVHAPERVPSQALASYSTRCLTCHQWQSCGASKSLGIKIKQDCISCHMPLQQTNAIVSVTAGRTLRASIRTHWIKVYP